jgi:iron(III) transport system permease protein
LGDQRGSFALAGAAGTLAAPRRAMPRGYALPVLLAVLLALLTVLPVATVIVASFRPSGLPLSDGWTLEHFFKVWSSAYSYRLVWQTLVFAAGSTGSSTCRTRTSRSS